MRRIAAALCLPLALLCGAAAAAAPSAKQDGMPQSEAKALDLAMRLMSLRTVHGQGNKTPEAMQLVRQELLAAGWREGEIEIRRLDDTALLIATWPGTKPDLKPLVISGHMDVVEARPSDWQRDPFTPVVEDGYLFGRGASDMKLDNAMGLTALMDLRRQGFRPRRSVVIAYSGDEETSMATSQVIAEQLSQAELVLNLDFDNNGVLDQPGGKPMLYTWLGAEKGYADFELSVTNPGGHSSEPRSDNAINQLAGALVRIGQHRFEARADPVTRAFFAGSARLEKNPELAGAMAAFARDPGDQRAIEVLRDDIDSNARIATTCVVTTIGGGHAVNALPQRVSANINCRLFPGHARTEVLEELRRVAAEPALVIRDVSEGVIDSPASALRDDFSRAVAKAMQRMHPGLPILPGMAKGASDCMWYRAKGVDCYVVSALFMHGDDYLSHGLNERAPIASIGPAIRFYMTLFSDLAK